MYLHLISSKETRELLVDMCCWASLQELAVLCFDPILASSHRSFCNLIRRRIDRAVVIVLLITSGSFVPLPRSCKSRK